MKKTQRGRLRLIGTGENDVSLESDCRMISEHDQLTIEFDESVTGMEGTQSVIVISDGVMTLNRTGQYESCLVFECGREMPVTFHSPFGDLEFVLRTDRLELEWNENGAVAEIDYAFCSGEETTLKNSLHLECGAEHPGSGK